MTEPTNPAADRSEIAEHGAAGSADTDAGADRAGSAVAAGTRHRARTSVQVVLLVLATVVAVVTPMAVWGRNLLLDTDRYVQTMAPVAADPGVQQAIIDRVDTAVSERLDVAAIVKEQLPRASVLAAPLQAAVDNLVDNVVTKFVQSEAFQKLWTTMNRVAHAQIVALLTGSKRVPGLRIDSAGRVLLSLAPIVSAVEKQLAATGLTVAQAAPPVSATFQIAQVSGLAKARSLTRLLDNVANWLPWIFLALVLASIAAAVRRRRAVLIAAACTAGAMLFLGLGLLVGRHFYLGAVPTETLPRPVARDVFDTVTRYLRDGIRTVFVVALLIMLIAWLAGPSRAARAARGLPARFSGSGLGSFVDAHRRPVATGIGVLALAVLLFWPEPSGTTVLVVLVVGAALAGAVWFGGRSRRAVGA